MLFCVCLFWFVFFFFPCKIDNFLKGPRNKDLDHIHQKKKKKIKVLE